MNTKMVFIHIPPANKINNLDKLAGIIRNFVLI